MATKPSKRFRSIEKSGESFSLAGAVDLLKKQPGAKFDESVDVSFHLNLLKKHTVRDTIALPHAFGKTKKILVFAKEKKAEEARAAGADYVGDADLIAKIEGGWMDFEVAIATPDMMKDVARVARFLGSRGLMPSPKAKTVTLDVAQAISEVKAGRREFRADADGVVNFSIGKKSMSSENLLDNAKEFFTALLKKKPSDLKGDYIKSIYISPTMGKSVKVNQRTALKG